MKTVIDAGSAKFAGLQIDLLSKYRAGQISVEHIEWFNGLSKDTRDAILSGELVIASKEKTSEHKEVPKQKKKSNIAVLDSEIWQKVYEAIGLKNFTIADFPSPQEGFWDIPVFRGVTCNSVISA